MVEEERIEVVVPRSRRTAVVRALLAAHPYEEPAWDLTELADAGLAHDGDGRIGTVPEQTLRCLRRVGGAGTARDRPRSPGGRVTPSSVRTTGRAVRGAGDFLLDTVRRTDADVYVTSDLRHHPGLGVREQDGPALIDVAHWAAESTWLPVVEARLRARAGRYGGDPGQRRRHRPVDLPPLIQPATHARRLR